MAYVTDGIGRAKSNLASVTQDRVVRAADGLGRDTNAYITELPTERRPFAYFSPFLARQRELEKRRREKEYQDNLRDEAEVLMLIHDILPWL